MSLNLDNEDEIFKFLLDKNDNNIDSNYLKIINEIEYDVKNKLKNKKFSNLYCVNINFENFDWINEKYKILINNQITLDLITDNILSFYEKKVYNYSTKCSEGGNFPPINSPTPPDETEYMKNYYLNYIAEHQLKIQK